MATTVLTRGYYIQQMVEAFVPVLQETEMLDEETESQLTNPANLPLVVAEYDAFLGKMYKHSTALEELRYEQNATRLAARLRHLIDSHVKLTGNIVNNMMISGFHKLADAIDNGDLKIQAIHKFLRIVCRHLEMYAVLMENSY